MLAGLKSESWHSPPHRTHTLSPSCADTLQLICEYDTKILSAFLHLLKDKTEKKHSRVKIEAGKCPSIIVTVWGPRSIACVWMYAHFFRERSQNVSGQTERTLKTLTHTHPHTRAHAHTHSQIYFYISIRTMYWLSFIFRHFCSLNWTLILNLT